eukprot:TRINITY_DN312_c0_g1_i1.p1 TRINITY_DN312_c0_g1~~TRINITY_DN312_c0_g1_i1.p1  ORF type:complete len:220 (+),score=52.38 TRINITY_DN312_c0_g1_i1:110-769(+)
MSLKLVYFAIPARAESIRLCLTLGGVEFEDKRLQMDEWAKLKQEVEPKQLPLLYIGDNRVVGQAVALTKYAAKISKFEGKPLYPEDPLLALEVDEFADYVAEIFTAIGATFKMEDEAERQACRLKLVSPGGDIHKWLSYIDNLLGKSKSGFAVGDHLTLADVMTFCQIQPMRSGFLDGVPVTCLDEFKNIQAHKEMMAAIPIIKAYYAVPKMPVYNVFQ